MSVTSEQVVGAVRQFAPKRRLAPAWERRYANKLLATDVGVVVGTVFLAQVLRFGIAVEELSVPLAKHFDFAVTYTTVSLTLIAAWLLALSIWDTRKTTVLGTGPTEYARVTQATLMTFGVYAIIAFSFKAQVGRGYLLIALPLGLLLLLVTRWLWRKRLHRQRAKGANTYRTLLVGERQKVRHVAAQILRDTPAGFHLVGAITEHGTERDVLATLPVLGNFESIIESVDAYDVDTVIITSTDSISPDRLREIGWDFEARGIDLIVTAALTDIAGPRIHMRPVAGLPLIHVDYPELTGRKIFAKRVFDLFFSSVGLVLLSPVFLVVALLVKLSSPGPVFFLQERVGQAGKPFKMFKFRSMVVDAEAQLPDLMGQSDGNGVLFKLKDDPRITKIGSWLRRYSLDELPQIANVFLGQMSLVGPRPPLPSEVAMYELRTHRRLLVRPGITGLWQVSGRSDLSWEDSIRLDLYYVENWSMIGDVVLLWRTMRTVMKPEGAY